MFKLSISTRNDAFSDGESEFAGPELARILREVADRVQNGVPTGDSASVKDANGATVGEWSYDAETDEG
jgi:hypothetical protein